VPVFAFTVFKTNFWTRRS